METQFVLFRSFSVLVSLVSACSHGSAIQMSRTEVSNGDLVTEERVKCTERASDPQREGRHLLTGSFVLIPANFNY
eukprot:810392-Amphidinium_carterae.1